MSSPQRLGVVGGVLVLQGTCGILTSEQLCIKLLHIAFAKKVFELACMLSLFNLINIYTSCFLLRGKKPS